MPRRGFHFVLTGPVSIPACMRRNITSLKVTKGSMVLRRRQSICRLLSLGVDTYCLTITKLPGAELGSITPGVTAGCPRVTTTCFHRRKRRIRVVGLGNSVRLTPVVKLTSQVISVMSANQALGRGKLIRCRAVINVASELVIGPIDCHVGSRHVDRLIKHLARMVTKRRVHSWDRASVDNILPLVIDYAGQTFVNDLSLPSSG